jgi:hypothetical protein
MKIKLEARFKSIPMTIENPDLYLDNKMIGITTDGLEICLPDGYQFDGEDIVDQSGEFVFSVLCGEDYVFFESSHFALFLKIDNREWQEVDLDDNIVP